jgi:hypothetical protein
VRREPGKNLGLVLESIKGNFIATTKPPQLSVAIYRDSTANYPPLVYVNNKYLIGKELPEAYRALVVAAAVPAFFAGLCLGTLPGIQFLGHAISPSFCWRE